MSFISGQEQNIFRQTNPFEPYIEQILESETGRLEELHEQKNQHEERQSAVSEVGSKLSSFSNTLEDFRSPLNDTFNPLTASTTAENAFSLTVNESELDEPQDYDINVDNVAQRDIALSDTFENEDTTLLQVHDFTVEVGDVERTISVDGTDAENNREVLDMIAEEINLQFDDVEEGVQANVFDVDSDNAQISVKSDELGSDNRITIAGEGQLDFENLIANEENLDAQFTIDGVDFTRQDNTIDDVIDGVTINLNSETTNTEQISVERDLDQAMENIEQFIAEYNEINNFIRSQTFLDGESGNRGPLQQDRVFRTLTNDLQLEAISPFGSNLSDEEQEDLPELSFETIMDIGINFNQSGEMEIDDREELEEALLNTPGEVEEFFTNPDAGKLTLMEDQLDRFISGSDSVVNNIENTIDMQMERTEDRIDREMSRLETREEQLRDEFSRLHQTILEAQSQQQRLQSVGAQMGGMQQAMLM